MTGFLGNDIRKWTSLPVSIEKWFPIIVLVDCGIKSCIYLNCKFKRFASNESLRRFSAVGTENPLKNCNWATTDGSPLWSCSWACDSPIPFSSDRSLLCYTM